jgi:hypothetical protein
VWDRVTGTFQQPDTLGLTVADSRYQGLALSADGWSLAFRVQYPRPAGGEGVLLWDRTTGRTSAVSLPDTGPGGSDTPYDLSFSADGRWLLVGESSGALQLWDRLSGGTELLRSDAAPDRVSLSADARSVAYAASAREPAGSDTRQEEIFFLELGSTPSAPGTLAAAPLSAGQVRLQWRESSTNESGFRIERKEGAGAYREIGTVPANTTTYTDGGLTAGTVYTYRVRAYNPAGTSSYSNEATTVPGVTLGGKLVVKRSLSFGTVRLGRSRTRRLVLRNRDRQASLLVRVRPLEGEFTTDAPERLLLPPGGHVSLSLTFTARGAFYDVETLVLESSDPHLPQVGVGLSGQGRQ